MELATGGSVRRWLSWLLESVHPSSESQVRPEGGEGGQPGSVSEEAGDETLQQAPLLSYQECNERMGRLTRCEHAGAYWREMRDGSCDLERCDRCNEEHIMRHSPLISFSD